jgi:DNA helicase HerA-like ATPase
MPDEIAPGEKEVAFGDPKNRHKDLVYLGKMAEASRALRKVWMDISGEQVVAVVGKRGSGKSFTLGVILEALAASVPNKIGVLSEPRSSLLLDTLDIFWPSLFPLTDAGTSVVKEQYHLLPQWSLEPQPLNVTVWIPAGFEQPSVDLPEFKTFRLGTSDFDAYDWATLLDVDLVMEPRGQLLSEVYRKLRIDGYTVGSIAVPPKKAYSIGDMLECIERDDHIVSDYAKETRRAVSQRLQAYMGYPLITASGTSLKDLLQPGAASILLLGRVDDDLRAVITSVLVRKIMVARSKASFIRKRLKTDTRLERDPTQKATLEKELEELVPRTWIMIDEAQNAIPSDRKTSAQDAVIRLVKEGRNYGLSFALTTQQPSAIDQKVMSQVITFIVHQLATNRDIDGVRQNLKSAEIEKCELRKAELDFVSLIRSLGLGQAIVSSVPTPSIARSFIINVRPRVTVHGGFED